MPATKKKFGERIRVIKDFTGTTSRTEQHHRDAVDINKILPRHGVNRRNFLKVLSVGAPEGGVQFIDYTVDLQQGLSIAKQTREAWANVPKELQDRYGSWEAIAAAMNDGSLKLVTKSQAEKEKKKQDLTNSAKADTVNTAATTPPKPTGAPNG